MECFILQRSCWKLCTSLWILTWGIIFLCVVHWILPCHGQSFRISQLIQNTVTSPFLSVRCQWWDSWMLIFFRQKSEQNGGRQPPLSTNGRQMVGPFILQASPVLLCSICPASFTRIASQNPKRRRKPNSSFSMSLCTNNLGRGRLLRLKLDFLAFPLHIFF